MAYKCFVIQLCQDHYLNIDLVIKTIQITYSEFQGGFKPNSVEWTKIVCCSNIVFNYYIGKIYVKCSVPELESEKMNELCIATGRSTANGKSQDNRIGPCLEKTCLCLMGTTKAQIRSVPLFFAAQVVQYYLGSILILIISRLTSRCSRAGWFEPYRVANPQKTGVLVTWLVEVFLSRGDVSGSVSLQQARRLLCIKTVWGKLMLTDLLFMFC